MDKDNLSTYTDESMMEIFKKKATTFSIITLLILILATAISLLLVNYTDIFRESDSYSIVEHQLYYTAKVSDGEIEELPLKLDINDVVVSGNYIKLNISGVNTTDEIWTPLINNFVLTSNNLYEYETRYKYYPSNFKEGNVAPEEEFSYNLSFYVENASKKVVGKHIFTLTIFVKSKYAVSDFEIDCFEIK